MDLLLEDIGKMDFTLGRVGLGFQASRRRGVTCSILGESRTRPGSLGVAGRGALVSTGVAGRGAEVSDPARPCQPSWGRQFQMRFGGPGHAAAMMPDSCHVPAAAGVTP